MKLNPRYVSSRSPMRVSFIGGGTDYESYFKKCRGQVISATIDRYVYVNTLPHTHFVEDKFKFTYKVTESVDDINKIKHPVVRKVLPLLNWNEPLNISTMADLPGTTGLGSSSAFVSAFVSNMWKRLDIHNDKKLLAQESIKIERGLLGEPGGWQDQVSTVYGGFNSIEFFDKDFEVFPITLEQIDISSINSQLYLLNTGIQRENLKSAASYQTKIELEENQNYLNSLAEVSQDFGIRLRQSDSTESVIKIMKDMLDESWKDKKKLILDSFTEPNFIRLLNNLETLNISYKMVGSGGGGFLLLMATPSQISELMKTVKESDLLSINLSFAGTEILQDIN